MYVTTISSLKEQKYEIYWKNYSLNDAVVLKVEPQRFTTTKNEALKLYGSGGFSLWLSHYFLSTNLIVLDANKDNSRRIRMNSQPQIGLKTGLLNNSADSKIRNNVQISKLSFEMGVLKTD